MQEVKQKLTIQEKRAQLSQMSAAVAPLVEMGQFENINSAVLQTYYQEGGNTEFHTYKQWKEKGFQVKKGATAFFIWAKPLSAQAAEKNETLSEETRDFYPLCFLFSNLQVEPL